MKTLTTLRYIEFNSGYWMTENDSAVYVRTQRESSDENEFLLVADGAPEKFVDVYSSDSSDSFLCRVNVNRLHETEGDAYRAIADDLKARAETALLEAERADEERAVKLGIFSR